MVETANGMIGNGRGADRDTERGTGVGTRIGKRNGAPEGGEPGYEERQTGGDGMYAVEYRREDGEKRFVMLRSHGIEAAEGPAGLMASLFHTREDAQAACRYMRKTPAAIEMTRRPDLRLKVTEVHVQRMGPQRRFKIRVDGEDENRAYIRFEGRGILEVPEGEATRLCGTLTGRGALEHVVLQRYRMYGEIRMYGATLVEEKAGE